ncbi:TylF/MycF/NovP-related O-methyltransferase [Maridesulfovibrio sp.]|uniref:TylF/MycF/NovP-related O-methyltransferase n=1 Tax=Maridesulfovibrio sp. TaxID=2795000 RepID=UPI002A189503|nr:TylF/MycF/NovP-related O-methyltransferase [Maridesulfovibrio sp.]
MFEKLYKVVQEEFEKLPADIPQHYLPYPPKSLQDKFRWLLACGKIFCPEYRFKSPHVDWWNDEEFCNYLSAMGEDWLMNSDRRWNMLQFMKFAHAVPGDTAECGAYRGSSSYLICKENKEAGSNRHHHIFDSFEGLSEPNEFDGGHWEKNALQASEVELMENLQEFVENISVYKGWIPDHFHKVEDLKFSFVHIDVDLYAPTLQSIRFFYPRLNPGGVLVCDDYGVGTCPGCTKAINEFMADKPESVISLSTGACVLIKDT